MARDARVGTLAQEAELKAAFPRWARLTRSAEFEAIYRGGLRLNAYPLRVRALKRRPAAAGSRLGAALSREIGSVALRNRWKRAIREAFRLQRRELTVPYDLVVSVERDAPQGDIRRVADAFRSIVAQLRERESAPPAR